MEDSWLVEVVVVIYYKIGQIPFVYLDLHIEGNRGCLSSWHRAY